MNLKNLAWNAIGLSLPLVLAALVIPSLLASIGTERFGILALAWGLIGYAGALDLGIGRAVTQKISSLRGNSGNQAIPDLVVTAVTVTSVTGGIGTLIVTTAAFCGAHRLINAPSIAPLEMEISMILVGLALPMQALGATYRGINEAYLNFGAINVVRVLLGAANFALPYLVAFLTTNLNWLVGSIVVSRAIALLFFRLFAWRCVIREGVLKHGTYRGEVAKKLLEFGGWFSLSSIITPIMMQGDRFLLGVLMSSTAITLYAIPYEITVQTVLIVGAVTTVAFPVISNLVQISPIEARERFQVWLWRTVLLMLCLMAFLAYAMPFILSLWVGKYVGDTSVFVGQILCVGVVFYTIGTLNLSLLHAHGRTKWTAILHLTELPLFAVTLYVMVSSYGVVGAAITWTLRVGLDALGLSILSRRLSGNSSLASKQLEARQSFC